MSRITDRNGVVTITTFRSIDGLAQPARNVAVDAQGTAWVATEEGLFRIDTQGGSLTGVVHDVTGTPVAGADVLVLGTPFRTVTEADGRFVLRHVPPESTCSRSTAAWPAAGRSPRGLSRGGRDAGSADPGAAASRSVGGV